MEGYRFSYRLRVRYSEIDGQKVVFNAHYMTYIDCAVTEYHRDLHSFPTRRSSDLFLEGLALDLTTLAEEGKFDIVLVKSTLEYKKPARVNEWLTVWCRMKKIGRSSMTMDFVITKEGESDPLVTAEIVYVCYDALNEKAMPVPTFVRKRIEVFEKADLS